jgi:hypothetical protein
MDSGFSRVAAIAKVDDRRPFICTAQLNVGILDLFTTALGACFVNSAISLQIVLLDSLDT